MIWEIQTQRFSLPSSLGPELSRFWGNRTSVSHPHCLSAKPISFLFFVFTFLSISAWFALLSSAVCAAVGCWESVAGLFCPLASADVANNCQVRRASRGGVVKTIQISFSFTTPHREDTNPACVASFASCFLFLHPESFSRYMLATTHSRTPRSRLLSFNARIRTLKGRMISFGCGHVKFTSFFCVCVTCST